MTGTAASITLFAAVVAAPTSQATIAFDPPGTFPAGDGAHDLEVFDVNLDGVPDLTVAGFAPNYLRGLGSGAMDPPSAIAPAVETNGGTAAGQFDATPGRDLAVVDGQFDPDRITVMRSRGIGTFRQPKSYKAGGGPYDIAAGDFDGDGRTDLAASSLSSKRIAVLFGRGNGTFLPPQRVAVGIETAEIAAGDLNRDGRDDLAAATFGVTDDVVVAYGKANRDLRVPNHLEADDGGTGIVIHDIDRDGRVDLALTHTVTGNDFVALYYGKRKGFKPPVPLQLGADTSPSGLSVGDLNGTGLREVVVANIGDNIAIFEQSSKRTFESPVSFAVGDEPQDVRVAKLDPDGLSDVVTANDLGDNVTVLINGQ